MWGGNRMSKKLRLISVLIIIVGLIQTNLTAFAALELKPYTTSEFKDFYDKPYNSNDMNTVKEMLRQDFSSVITDTKDIEVTVDENSIQEYHIENFGLGIELQDIYNRFFKNGQLMPEWIEAAKKAPPIPVWRWGGYTSTYINFLHQIGPVEKRTGGRKYEGCWGIGGMSMSDFNVVDETPKSIYEYPPYQCGPGELLQIMYANNPQAQAIPCISLYVTPPEDAKNFARFMYDDADESEWGALRYNYYGIKEPVKVFCWELGNEIDSRGGASTRAKWYCEAALKIIEAIREVEPTAKFCVNGATAPFQAYMGGSDDPDKYWASWHRSVMEELAPYVEFISQHPYPDGISPEFCQYFNYTIKKDIDEIVKRKDIRDENGNLKDIKIFASEFARWYPPENWYWGATCAEGAVSVAHYLVSSLNYEYNGVTTYFGLNGSIDQWTFYGRDGDEFLETPTTKLFRLLLNNTGDRILKTTWESAERTSGKKQSFNQQLNFIDGESDSERRYFSAATIGNGNDEIIVICVNKEGYMDAEINFNFNNEYTLVEKTVFDAPNKSTVCLDKESAEYTTVTTTKENTPDFKTIHMAPETVVALRLKTKKKLPLTKEEADKMPVGGEESIEYESAFADTQTHWAKNEIAAMKENGFVSGITESEFYPDKNITMGEFAAIASRIIGCDETYNGSFFYNLSGNEWYAKYANCLKAEGCIRDSVFNGDDFVSFVKACEIANRIFDNKGGKANSNTSIDVNLPAFSDLESDIIKKAVSRNILYRLFEEGSTDFKRNITRAEAASILYHTYLSINR